MADERRGSGGRGGGDGNRPASITFAGDASNEQLGGLRDSTRAEQQARMRVASSAAQQVRKVEAERQQSKTKAKDPERAKATARRTDLRTVAQSQTQRGPGNAQRQASHNSTQSRAAQAIARYNARQSPAAPSNATHVSRRELGNLRVPTKAQLQSQLNAASYSPEKQQRIASQWQQTKGRAMNFVQSQNQERTTDLRSVSQNRERTTNLRTVSQAQSRSAGRAQAQEKTPTHDGTTVRPRTKKRPEQRFSEAFSKQYQQGKKGNVFERHSPKRSEPVSLKTVAQNLAPTAQKGQAQSAGPSQEKGKQQGKEPAKNVFNKHSPPRDKSQAQQQEKGKSRGR